MELYSKEKGYYSPILLQDLRVPNLFHWMKITLFTMEDSVDFIEVLNRNNLQCPIHIYNKKNGRLYPQNEQEDTIISGINFAIKRYTNVAFGETRKKTSDENENN